MGVRLRTAAVSACFVALMVVAPAAQATFPGQNGKIAVSEGGSGADIVLWNPDGSDSQHVTGPPRPEFSPGWSPDGSKVAFARYEGGVDKNLFIVNADGTGERRLTAGFGQRDNVSWSPDGRQIVFAAATDCATDLGCGRDLVVLDVQTTFGTPITNDAERDATPAWSPDGDRIAFTRTTGCPSACNSDIWTIRPDGTDLTRLTLSSAAERDPNWSPDGRYITYESEVRPLVSEIYRMNADGSGQTQLTFTSGAYFESVQPAWSPDGSRIVFISVPVSGCQQCGQEVFHMRADGSDVTRVTNNAVEDDYPDWQPIPNRPPDCSGVTASPSVLRSHNRRFVPVTLDGATDPDGDPVSIAVDGVTQDEPVRADGDRTSPDAIAGSGSEVRVRAERNPHGDGRVYRIAFTASDGRGGFCSGTATVSVPRKQHKPAVDSAPPSYDSFAR